MTARARDRFVLSPPEARGRGKEGERGKKEKGEKRKGKRRRADGEHGKEISSSNSLLTAFAQKR